MHACSNNLIQVYCNIGSSLLYCIVTYLHSLGGNLSSTQLPSVGLRNGLNLARYIRCGTRHPPQPPLGVCRSDTGTLQILSVSFYFVVHPQCTQTIYQLLQKVSNYPKGRGEQLFLRSGPFHRCLLLESWTLAQAKFPEYGLPLKLR